MTAARPAPTVAERISRRTALDRDPGYRAFDREAEVRLAVDAHRDLSEDMGVPTSSEGPWSFDEPTERPGIDGAATLTMPREAQVLLDALSPLLAVVGEALAPLLASHGLSAANATVEQLLEVEGLADAVLDAATAAVAQVDAIGLGPSAPGPTDAQQTSGLLPQDWPHQPSYDLVGVHDPLSVPAATEPVVRTDEGLPAGWDNEERGPVGLMYDEDGEPCYPDAPPFEERWPKCPLPEPGGSDGEVPCREDIRFVRAEERLRSLRSFGRVPSSFRGFDYRGRLEDSVSEPLEALYRCGHDTGHKLASWFGPPVEHVLVHQDLLDLELEWDLLSFLTGPVDFRAAVLLHEHVHRIEDPRVGTVSAPPDRDYRPLGSRGQQGCPMSGTEYDAAYVQALYLGAGEATARMVADIYGRRQCEQLSRGAQLLAAAGDIVEVLTLGWLRAIEVVATLTGRLASDGAAALLAALFPSGIAGVVLLGLPV